MYGLEVKNSSGNIIIDGKYKNYAEWASGTTTLGYYVTTIAFTATSQLPLIALRPATGTSVVLWGLRKTGSNYDGFYVIGYNGTDLDWKIYIAHPGATAETYGLRVYDSGANLVFDSGYNYFNLYQITTGISLATPTLASSPYQDVSHAGISDPYYFVSPLGFWAYGIASGSQVRVIFRTSIMKNSATSGRVGWGGIFSGPSGGSAYDEGWNPTLNLMVLK